MALVFVGIAQAKDHTIVVRHGHPLPTGATEVIIGGTAESDTIAVTPGKDVTGVEVVVKNVYGNILAQYWIAADDNTPLNLNMSETQEDCLMEIRDKRGVVYSEYEF